MKGDCHWNNSWMVSCEMQMPLAGPSEGYFAPACQHAFQAQLQAKAIICTGCLSALSLSTMLAVIVSHQVLMISMHAEAQQKKRKRMRIKLKDAAANRKVFDEEGSALDPFEMLARWAGESLSQRHTLPFAYAPSMLICVMAVMTVGVVVRCSDCVAEQALWKINQLHFEFRSIGSLWGALQALVTHHQEVMHARASSLQAGGHEVSGPQKSWNFRVALLCH